MLFNTIDFIIFFTLVLTAIIIYKNRNWHNYVPEKNYLGHPNIEGCKEIGRILSKAFLQSSRMQLL